MRFQVIPYSYVHLVSMLANWYCLVYAVTKGRVFGPDADLFFGFFLPIKLIIPIL